jgi:hypothetical protein
MRHLAREVSIIKVLDPIISKVAHLQALLKIIIPITIKITVEAMMTMKTGLEKKHGIAKTEKKPEKKKRKSGIVKMKNAKKNEK